MTANEYPKATDICSELSRLSDQLVEAVEGILDIEAKKLAAGYDLTDNGFEAHIATTTLKYITDGTDFNNVMGSANAIKTAMVASGHWGVFQKVRP